MEYDLIVVGGGISGCAAAISAARCGLDVLLIERYGFLGGTPRGFFHVDAQTGEVFDSGNGNIEKIN